MALIDRYVAQADFREVHRRRVDAPPALVLAAALAYRAGSDPLYRGLMGLREAPMRLRHLFAPAKARTAPFDLDRFTLLAEDESEIVRGLAGRFWEADFGLVAIPDEAAFRCLETPGLAKLCLNFHAQPDGRSGTVLSTETRVVCTDEAARRRFRPYWLLIRPMSGLIRHRTLRAISEASVRAQALASH